MTAFPSLATFLRAVLALSALCFFSLPGCRKAEVKQAIAVEETNPAEVTVTPALAAQLKIGEPKMRDVAGSLQVAARVETDASRIARVGSPVAGRITRLLVLEGQRVRAGAALATLHSTDLSDTQFAFVKAYSQENLAEQATKRAEQLVAADVIGRAELERRRAELLQASTEEESYRTQLRGLGMSEASIQQLLKTRKLNADYPVVSSVGGTVLERKVTIGQIVQPAELAFLVADLSNVWILADVPEENAGKLHRGMQVLVTIPSLPGKEIHGTLSYVAPIVDPETRTVQVRMDLANPEGIYKPAMLASMTFLDRDERKLTIPSTAVVREDNKNYVFVQTAPNRFLLREVTLGAESDDDRILDSGVSPGEKIVLEGAFGLNNQRKQNAVKAGA
ncbi:efflux RND transporter periplasmic adaptor subunit [Acidipila rosea]|uniref:Cobalt-zinc-cadmium efflux system membrane fusion protein n=1 Tax=Acidipila rosea TaxID=768535 RepID=A0A4R1L458_9BACT|nr:efflux RND transporter periplasmic adaptor subunit [Acidipila rosea]MBW4027966.1 efflux RND transporter periplasmic adaptor subunit [Acidobacteriota bacterium]MBW4045811.1 efflux RND transporter periplasmic adaptor subunit [Acidobacteriota bacterium]TCK71877.1 cobalt-zinc-cadmium efflux system membrane fusion protein [Acidipila rosea]